MPPGMRQQLSQNGGAMREMMKSMMGGGNDADMASKWLILLYLLDTSRVMILEMMEQMGGMGGAGGMGGMSQMLQQMMGGMGRGQWL